MSTKTTTASAGAQWFALHTLSGQENKVKNYIERFKVAEELDDAIFEVLLTTEVVSEVKNGKKSTKVRKLYPGSVFIQMNLYGSDGMLINKPWYFVKEVAGVIGFVGGEHGHGSVEAFQDGGEAFMRGGEIFPGAARLGDVGHGRHPAGLPTRTIDQRRDITPRVKERTVLAAHA